jgi:hypothetical protein
LAEELEPLWLAALLLRVLEAFGRYISLHSARPCTNCTAGTYSADVASVRNCGVARCVSSVYLKVTGVQPGRAQRPPRSMRCFE